MEKRTSPISLGGQLGMKLGASIIRGEYGPGDRLPTEHELCQAHSVSRGAVREAIKVLASKGLVASQRRHGTVVRPVQHWNLMDPEILSWLQEVEYSHSLLHELIQVRIAIEPEACALVAGRRDLVDFKTMGQAVRAMEDNTIRETELLQADLDFHLAILDATGNRFFQQFRPLIRTTLRFGYELVDLYKLFDTDRKISSSEHREVLQLMLDGKISGSRSASRAMIERMQVVVVELMAGTQSHRPVRRALID